MLKQLFSRGGGGWRDIINAALNLIIIVLPTENHYCLLNLPSPTLIMFNTFYFHYCLISHSSQCSMTDVTKVMVCPILSVGWCI